ncbi:DNA polymerase III subunit delta [Oceanobacillus locisalsi]|uniref:DNA polymerase III subunit delta n=1 Tax=Oceanobacillus locisalsi TaxID=546107 RepID=A0ABW3NF89_9BACI
MMDQITKIKSNQLQSVYFAFGTESFFLEQLKKRLVNTALEGDKTNLSVYDLEETPIQDVLADAETFPFFGDRKLIFAINASFVKTKPDKTPFEHDIAYLQEYLQNPPEYSILLITAPYEKLDERKKVTKQLKKQTYAVDCQAVQEKDARTWIQSLTNSYGIEIDRDAMEILEAEVSSNIQLLQSEIGKLALYVGENGVVTKEVARQLVSHTPTTTSIALVDAVMKGSIQEAIHIYKDLEKMNEDPIAMIGLLAYQFRMILRVKQLKKKGYSQFQIQKNIGAHPYVIKVAMAREAKLSEERLAYIISQLAETDAKMKQGLMEKGLAFELLLMDLV